MRVVAFLVLATSVEVSPVQKVVELLVELKGKVEADLAADEKLMSEYSHYCDEENNAKTDAIREGKRTIKDLDATIAEASASISTLTTEVSDLAGKISTAEKELSSASGVRAKAHKDFAAVEKDLVETIDTLQRATVVLSRGQTSFLQRGGDLSALTSALGQVVDAAWVTSSQKAKVAALLQSQDSDQDLALTPQATSSAFESQGGGILDTLKDMTEKAESTLSGARQDEMASSHDFEMLKQSLETEIGTMKKRMAAASTEKAGTEQSKASAGEELASTHKTVDADSSFLADLDQSCAAKAAEWDARQKSAAGELDAIAKAKSILEDGVKVFLQVTATRDDQTRRDQVAGLLTGLATSDHSYVLAQIAQSAKSDPFGKVRGLVESMIDRLTKEAAEEADAKSFCDAETSKSKAKQAELTADADKHAARIEQASAARAQLNEQIKQLEANVAEMDSAHAEATQLRSSEHAEYLKASKDYKDSAEAVANAIQVLTDYYQGSSFVQLSQAPELGGAKTDVAGTIMSMLEVAESDFTELLAEADADERSAKTSYDKLTQKTQVAKAAATTDAKGKEGEVKRLDTSLLNYKEDAATTGKELDAVLSYLDELKPQCEAKVMSYAERKARREQEIEGLQQALEILAA